MSKFITGDLVQVNKAGSMFDGMVGRVVKKAGGIMAATPYYAVELPDHVMVPECSLELTDGITVDRLAAHAEEADHWWDVGVMEIENSAYTRDHKVHVQVTKQLFDRLFPDGFTGASWKYTLFGTRRGMALWRMSHGAKFFYIDTWRSFK